MAGFAPPSIKLFLFLFRSRIELAEILLFDLAENMCVIKILCTFVFDTLHLCCGGHSFVKKLLSILFSLLSFSVFACHQRAGEITYRCLGGYTYEITVVTYTIPLMPDAPVDRCSLTVCFGTGDSAIVCRSNVDQLYPTATADPGNHTCKGNTLDCPNAALGEWSIFPSALKMKKNVYKVVYTYPGPGYYCISMTDPDRDFSIVNIPDHIAFTLQDTLLINPFLSPNNSPVFTILPFDRACQGQYFVLNPGAVDPDKDSLSYNLCVSFKEITTPIEDYFIPSGVSVNPITGDFIWNVPPSVFKTPPCDRYNFAMDIREWKLNLYNGKRYLAGVVHRDIQVIVCNCQNVPPVISNVNDTCIEANTALTSTIIATDTGNNMIQSFTATGYPFSTIPSAIFTSNAPTNSPCTGIFTWIPSCNQVRKNPYIVTLKATDDGTPDDVTLTNYKTFFITVVSPAPKNLSAIPQCNDMLLKWDIAPCNPSGNGILAYKIYRKTGCDKWMHGYCETGVPSYTGYTLIGTVSYNTTSYIDNNGGNGLIQGSYYSYLVVAYYLDGAESYASNLICKKLVRDVSIITNVDVKTTNTTNGKIFVKWVKPIPDAANFDTTLAGNTGPYQFKLYRSDGYTNPTSLIATFNSPYFASLTTSYLDSGLNTQTNPYVYRVDFFSGSTVTCSTQSSSSVFVSCFPLDNKIKLTWQENVPWINTRYNIFKFNKATSVWDSIKTTALQTFTDSGLANGSAYCYKVKSIGAYSDTTIPTPLINWSQEICCVAEDKEPPCPSVLTVDSNCVESKNILSWNNPNNSCSNDALKYIIYYSPVNPVVEFTVLDTIHNIHTTTFVDDSLFSIAGCYAITSVDSFGKQSAFSNIVCIDNCPYYQLPNVFTPNGDGNNDFFISLHPYKYVKDVDIKIYDRWGVEVFRTTNPEILWDGKSAQTKMLCSDGVYYYVCIVNEIRLEGIIPRVIKGNVHLMGKK
ncbi:MAG: gliding motility-associated C-terminal domain-containing protein [Bacteroidota bacterium]